MAISHSLPLLVFLFYCFTPCALGSRVKITNNGYRDIVVAISPDVQSTEATRLLNNIQRLMTKASVDLYTATRRRSYIQSVRILIPQTWGNVAANASTWENFQDADVQIDLPNSKYGDRPYTIQLWGCGDPGEYIHLTPNYVKNFDSASFESQFGPAGKVFVREWARLRYGIFEEHGYPGDGSAFPTFYQASPQQAMVPNVCSNTPAGFTVDYGCGKNPQTGLYDSSCTYSFINSFKPTSSIMSDYRTLSSATHFCDDEKGSKYQHNRAAPNKQNAVCNTQSTWSVISRHTDFAGNNNLPAIVDNLTPTFNIVRVLTGARYVLVTDVSGSMGNYNRITKLYDSARRWIKYDIANGTSLGIVKFSSTATALSSLTVVNDNTRAGLMANVPYRTEGATCIGCGLSAALQVLKPSGTGGVIVLVTDGEENVSPYIRDMYPALFEAEVQVVSVAFGRTAENEIEVLATKTNGKSHFIDDNRNDFFTGSLTYQPAVPMEELSVLLFQKDYKTGGSFSDSVEVDYTVGRSLTFRIEYANRNYITSFTVVSPSGQMYSQVTYDNSAKIGSIVIPDIAEEGTWTFTLIVDQMNLYDYATVIVTSKARSGSTAPITVECHVPIHTAPAELVAEVKQGRNPVLGASVQAYIESPNSALTRVDLLDNGVGADTTKGDGIYSRYYSALNIAGRYTIVCQVSSIQSTIDGTTVRQRTNTTRNFSRVKPGGAFKVEKPITTPYPPSRVTDLKVVAIQVDQMSVTIEWTAPGGQLDVGNASTYQIKYSTTIDNLMDSNFNSQLPVQFQPQDVIVGSMQPLQFGAKQRVTLQLPSTAGNATYYVALRATNAYNISSNTSNVVACQIVRMESPSTQPPTTTTTTTSTTTSRPETSTSVNTGCNGILTTSSGLLTSPNYPGPYLNNYNCQWIIRVAPASKVRLTFSHFDIERSFDFVEVYDGAVVSASKLLLKQSGSTVPTNNIVSSANEMLVRFVTDSTGNYFRGWRATYNVV